ncbi:MAG: DUF4911 domain-containing protein [Mariprofundaceae bacterium]|nr:DUF4911 domain-containing protein [Mariprofundaceae bacterium]
MKSSDIIILVVWLPKYAVVRFQSILDGEDGLATLRCTDKTSGEQELWTTKVQMDELRRWLAGMPPELEVKIVREDVFRGGGIN